MWPQFQQATLRVQQPADAIVQHLNNHSDWVDEWYSFRAPPTGVQVLLDIDEHSYQPEVLGIDLRMGAQHPLVWKHCIGKGRVFYSALGHLAATYADARYQQVLAQLSLPWVQPVPQHKVASHAALHTLLRQTVKAGGEGVMLHRGASLYRAARNDDLLKFKPFDDAEGLVIGHLPGRGKHAGRLGALVVQTQGGQRLRLGTGFTDAQREHPPALGVWVTFRHRGVTDQGIPRFASFLRVREDWVPGAQPAPK